MFEKPKQVERDHLRDIPSPAKYCGVEHCGRYTVIFIKEHNISRCAACYQRDLDCSGKSANLASVDALNHATDT